MASATITPSTGSPVTYANGDGLDKTGDGKFCTGISFADPDYGVIPFSGPGLDGQATNMHGFRIERLTLDLMYIGADEEAIAALWMADSLAMASGGPCGVSVADQTIVRAFLDGDASYLEQPTKTGLESGKCQAVARVSFEIRELEAEEA